jgi:serine phosphatase RsbU (regulator of sigma subunit)
VTNTDPHQLCELLNELPDAVFMLDSAARIIYISDGYTALTGLAKPGAGLIEFFELLVEADRLVARDAFTEALITQQPQLQIRVRLLAINESYIWAELNLALRLRSPLHGASSIGVFSDASSQVELAEKLAQTQREIVTANHELERLLDYSQDTLTEASTAFHRQLQSTELSTPYYALNIVNRPSYYLGGDIFFYRESTHGNLLVGLADAVGHGPAAALRGVAVKATALSYLHVDEDPQRLLLRLNEHAGDYLEPGAYFTLVLAEIDFSKRRARVFNCGGPPALHYSQQLLTLHANNPPIGLYPATSFTYHQLSYQPVAHLFMLSDGWLEPQGMDGRIAQIPVAKAFARFARGERISEEGLKQAVLAMVQDAHFVDDLSAVQITLKQR